MSFNKIFLRLAVLPLTAGLCATPELFAQQPQPGGQNPDRNQGSDDAKKGTRDNQTTRDQQDRTRPTDDANRAGGQASSAPMSGSERNFLQKAAVSGMAEVEIAQMALQKASSSDVKAYAQRMVTDHTNANQELKNLAQQKGVTLSEEKKEHKDHSKMANLSGEEFDRAFMSQQVKHHQKDVAEFERMSNSAKDPDVRAFASKTLPTLKEHLEQARTLSGTVGGKGKKS